MNLRRIALMFGTATAAAAAATVLRAPLRTMTRRFRTASSPSIGLYDAVAGTFLRGYYDGIARDCVAALEGTPEASVLEIGPGPGHLAEALLASVPDLTWTGLDIDPAMLDETRRRLLGSKLTTRASFVEGDAGWLPFDAASFDLVVSSLSAHHWPDAVSGFREIRRVLRPGGRALVYDLSPGWGRLETGSVGIGGASVVFPDAVVSTFRAIGPIALIRRAELRNR